MHRQINIIKRIIMPMLIDNGKECYGYSYGIYSTKFEILIKSLLSLLLKKRTCYGYGLISRNNIREQDLLSTC